MKRLLCALTMVPGLMALAPATASATTCSVLAAFVTGITGQPATAAILTTSGVSRCEVNLQLGPEQEINIRVGLPLNANDGGTGGVQGAWNGKVQNLGGGGFAGSVGAVTGPVAARYVGSSTDTGHSAAWCNAGNSLPGCGSGGAGFVLDQGHNLIASRVQDFIVTSLYEQTRWALDLAKQYYAMPVARNYWNGCSTGGRQGWELAQSHGDMFDGLLVGSPAMNWNRFQTGEMWPVVVAKDVAGLPAGITQAKSNAANAAAVAACDVTGGAHDGFISEPRRCTYDANALRCDAGNPAATCLTPNEAQAINMIWDGPRNQRGQRLWGGITRGTSFSTLLPGGNGPSSLPYPYVQDWVNQDPNWDWHQLTLQNFSQAFQYDGVKFRDDVPNPLAAATDNVNLSLVRAKKAKIIHYHGLADPLIVPFTSFNYVSRLFDRYGVAGTQTMVRSFFYPGQGHCGGGASPAVNATDLFNALVNWVENGVAPNYIVASQGAVRTRKICKYPDEAVYNGAGNPNDQANFQCVVHATEPADLRIESQTAVRYSEAP